MKSLTVQQLHQGMQTEEGVFLLDVRAASAYQDWRIQDEGVVSANIQNSKLKEHGPEAFSVIPKDKQVITVCAKGHAAQEAAQMLSDKGYDAVYLEGGMQAWSEYYYSSLVTTTNDLKLLQVLRPAKGCLSYFLVSQGEAVVVDPARHIQVYLNLAKEYGVQIRHVLDTHLHADHITGGHDLAAQTGAQYWISEGEMKEANRSFHALSDGLKLEFGASTLEVIAVPTPGHTPGSTSFLVNQQYLLSGDTVFVNGLGRPDLGGKAKEWAKMLYNTVVTRLNNLSDNTIVLPAHYSDYREITDAGYVAAVLGDLRATNDLLSGGENETRFTEAVTGKNGATPPNYETIIAINRGVTTVTSEEASDLEIGPNRCAVKHLA